jgi:hypothetical protein
MPHELLRVTEKGTASGIAEALDYLQPDAPLVLSWSDLIIGSLPAWPKTELPVICTADGVACRWTVAFEGRLLELPGAN